MPEKKHKKKSGKKSHVKSSVIPAPDPQVEELLPKKNAGSKEPEDDGIKRPCGGKDMPVWML